MLGRWLAIALLFWSQSEASAVAGDTYDLEYEMTLSMIERHKRLDIPVRPIMLVGASGRTTNQPASNGRSDKGLVGCGVLAWAWLS